MGTGLIYTNARNNVIKHGYEDVYGRNVSLWEYKFTHESGNTLLKVTPPGRRLSYTNVSDGLPSTMNSDFT